MKQHLPWLIGSTLLLGSSVTPAEAQLLDRLFGPPPPPMEELPPPRLRGNPYVYERVMPEEAYPEDPEAWAEDPRRAAEDPRRAYEFRERREAAPQEERRERTKRAARESREEPPKKSPAKKSVKREDASEAVSEARQQEDAQKALHHVELARTYFLQNPPPEGTEEKAKVAVIAGQAFPEDLKMSPLPGEIAFEVSAACPANYFAWGYDIVLADSCTRRAIAIIGMDGPQESAASEDASRAAERPNDAAPKAAERPAAAAAAVNGAPASETGADLSTREATRESVDKAPASDLRQDENRTGAVSPDANSSDRKDETEAERPAAAEAAPPLPRDADRAEAAGEEEPKSQTRPTPRRADTRQEENRQGS